MANYGHLQLSERQLLDIRDTAADWALTHGVVVRPRWGTAERGVGVMGPHTLFPSLVPRRLMTQASQTWPHFARLLHGAARNHAFLLQSLASVVEVDDFTRHLWNIYLAVHEEGEAQPVSLCLCRNDFMMCLGSGPHCDGDDCETTGGRSHGETGEAVQRNDQTPSSSNGTIPTGSALCHHAGNVDGCPRCLRVTMPPSCNGDNFRKATLCEESSNGTEDVCCEGQSPVHVETPAQERQRLDLPPSLKSKFDSAELKQIEINPFAAGTAGLCSQLVSLHRLTLRLAGIPHEDIQVPYNNPVLEMSKALLHAWRLYGNPRAVVLMVVSHSDPYTLDQRLLEFHLYDLDPHVKVMRRTFLDVHSRATMTTDRKLWIDDQEVALVYYRRGYGPACYPTEKEWSARLLLERSMAIKCPPIGVQLMGAKKVQQELCRPGVVERFLTDQGAVDAVRATFAKLYSLELTAEGDTAVEMALANPELFVLKHQRDGGNGNLFRDAVRQRLLEERGRPDRAAWVLMERLRPAWQPNFLIKRPAPPPGLLPVADTFTFATRNDVTEPRRQDPSRLTPLDVVSEIGVYGAYIRRGETELYTSVCGWMLRSKPLEVDQAGFTAGFAVYDTPLLVD